MNIKQSKFPEISPDKFRLIKDKEKIYDDVLKGKSVGYFRDAMNRFVRNKASVTAAVIIVLIVIFSLVAPFTTVYKISDNDGIYAKVRPKVKLFERSGFWDGSHQVRYNDRFLIYSNAIGMSAVDQSGRGNVSWQEGRASAYSPINGMGNPYRHDGNRYRDVSVDSYYEVGFRYITVPLAEFEKIKAWQEDKQLPILYPMVDTTSEYISSANTADANYWYRHAANGTPLNARGQQMTLEQTIEQGLIDNYLRNSEGEVQYYRAKTGGIVEARVLYYNYYQYLNGYEPIHYFGTDPQGYDILVRMANGVRLSLALAIFVSALNFILGSLYGAVEGYYGGAVDLVMERIVDVLTGIPFIITATLFQLHFVNPGRVNPFVGLLFAFCLTGWIGTSARVRTQFYRFKKEEYILSARTLGASDRRLMLKHIFPNAIGTIITSAALAIPSTILTESTLSFLGIVNFNSRTMTSLGTMMSNGQAYLASDPHILFFPAFIISLLMISFNLFGNGLRDAFNPSLRGAED